jgi:hypothetical protein
MEDDNFAIPCFEEDLENMQAEELSDYYSVLEKGGTLDFNWQCVGEFLFFVLFFNINITDF